MKLLKKYWPLIVIAIAEAGLFFLNYTPHTWLAGWDSLMPEFAPKINFLRSIFGIWQEHRGLGYADGMSHAAETLHVLVVWLFTYFLPLSLVRYAFVFLTHLIGGIGVYACIKKFIPDHSPHHPIPPVIALTGALYYLFNYATIQTYSVPFEPFIIQFALLPWLLYGLATYLDKPSGSTYVAFTLLCIAASAQYFVPTLFFGTTLLFISLLLSKTLPLPANRLKILTIVSGTYLLANFYWLAPYVATLPYTAPVIKNAKFNEMSSENVILNNQFRGSFLNVITLRGYLLDTDMPNQEGIFGYFFTQIRSSVDALPGILAALIMPFLAVISIIALAHRSKQTRHILLPVFCLVVVIGICIFLLGSAIPGISQIHDSIRQSFPILSEAFRDPFTKFRIPFALTLALLGSLGLWVLSVSIPRKFSRLMVYLTLSGIAYMSIPFGQGYFIHPYMRVPVPESYETLIQFMQKKPYGRIATFPQTTFWSWRTTDYGYTGSGFTWYGLPQSTMDRSFDPWSRENENYYWEITYALYKKNVDLFTKVLRKYNISYILIDKSIRALFGQTHALYNEQLSEMLQMMSDVKHIATFDKVTIYSVRNSSPYVDIQDHLPRIGPSYEYGDHDVAYGQFGNYVSSTNNHDIYFPFRPIFSKRGQKYSGITLSETPTDLYLSANMKDIRPSEYTISTPSASVAITLTNKALTASVAKDAALRYRAIAGMSLKAASAVACNTNSAGTANVTDEQDISGSWIRFMGKRANACLTVSADELAQRNGYIVAITNRHIQGKPLLISVANTTARHTEIDEFLTPDSAWHTDYFILPALASDGLGYSLYFTNEAKGNSDTVNDIKEIRIFEFPYNELTKVYFQKQNFISPIVNSFTGETPQGGYGNTDIVVDHPNPAYYRVSLGSKLETLNSTLILSQSFHSGWKAYDISAKCKVQSAKCQLAQFFPFLFGTELEYHMLINNWENGWILPSNPASAEASAGRQVTNDQLTIILFFWPQLLEWTGFLLLPIPFLLARKLS